MNCPSCGTVLADGTKYCPTCGTVIEAAAQRTTAPTQQMPAAQPAQHAVPMNPSTPPQQASRGFDTASMAPSPKWPYVLIAVLVVAIVAILLLIFRPWASSQAPEGDATVAGDDSTAVATVGTVEGTGDAATGTEPVVDEGSTTTPAATDAYDQLNSLYGQLAGFDSSISSVAGTFNDSYLSSDQTQRQTYASQAADLLAQIKAGYDEVSAMALSADSPYYATWNNMVTLYDCLYNRARVLSEAWNLSAQAADPSSVQDQISQVLGADNDSNGVNRYKTQYNELYPQSQPQQL
jgi:hypothetical protein